MNAYAPLLEKTRVPQPSLQKLSVISIFSKLRSAPNRLGPESEPGREAISFCLTSNSPAVVDQSVRELCRLVSDSVLDVSRSLLELQSALEACDPQFVPLFVKGLGFLVRIGYERKKGKWSFSSTDSHPFVRILLCREEVQTELLHQVLLFMMHNKPLGVFEVCEFLKPLLNFSMLRLPFSESTSSLFFRELISSMASLCCSFRCEAIPVFRLLMSCLQYVSYKSSDEVRNLNYLLESLVDAHIVVLRDFAGSGLPITELQLLGVELVDTVLSLCASLRGRHKAGKEPVLEQLKHLLAIQKDLGLQYVPGLSSSILSLFVILVKSELEHEQLSTLKFLQFLLNWKSENENTVVGVSGYPCEELLLVFPTINLTSSPSKSVKGVAINLLSILEKLLLELCAPEAELAVTEKCILLSGAGPIVFRLMQQLWLQDHCSSSSAVVACLAFISEKESETLQHGPKIWPSLLKEYSKSVYNLRRSSTSASHSQEVPLLLGAVAGLLVMHPSFTSDGIDSLAAISFMDPKMGVPVLLAVLFYINMLTQKDATFQNALPKLLGVLPSLASQSVMIPLVVQTIIPMLRKDVKPGLRATALRLLCQTWEVNDRAFSSLQGVLLPKEFINYNSERYIGICMAASIRDVCKKNPDRGVDLILSVQACIESHDCTIRALGVQSLSHLCEADVIDFYTAWNVINKNMQNFYGDPIILQSLCLLLRWGALDAAAYPEDSVNVLKVLWEIASRKDFGRGSLWTKARVYALQSLAQYEVSYIEKGIPELKKGAAALLFSETNAETLKALVDLQIKIMIHEHSLRRRHVKERKVTRSKIEKLVDVIPQAIFPSGKGRTAGEVPGAALYYLSFKTRNMGASKGHKDLNTQYEDAFKEVAISLQLSRNIVVALISLQSMKSYMRHWMRAIILPGDSSGREIASDKITKAANHILKSLRQMAEESIPRSAENIALGLGALCTDLPSSAHTIKAAASKFLLEWLFQHEHEHRQWTAALSLGLISSSLHVTDHKQKFQNISGLLEVLSCSKSTLVKGACGIGLGFSSQGLLTRTEAGSDTSNFDKQNNRNQEENLLLGRIVRMLSSTISQVHVASSDILETLSVHFPAGIEDSTIDIIQLAHEHIGEELDDDVWGIAGLVIGLGLCVGAVYRAGKRDTVIIIKDLLTSWMPHAVSPIPNTSFDGESSRIVMSVGSCLALPIVVGFCQKVELFDGSEVDHLMNSYRELISELLSVKKSSAIYKSLLMASCVGAGNLVACLLNVGIHPVKVESVKSLLELFRECYSRPYPPIVHFGGMLGVINALGAGAGNLEYAHPLLVSSHISSKEKGTSYVSGSLLSSPSFSQQLTPLVQEIFLIAQDSKDQSLQEYAAWAISVLGNYMRSREQQPSLNDDTLADTARPKLVSRNISEDTMVMKLALWLNNLNFSGTGSSLNIDTVATVLRCLARAPRLPALDWGAIVRRCMKHAASFTSSLLSESSSNQGTLREDCLLLSFAHASQFDVLISFLDELSDRSRFATLEFNLQSCLLCHLADLMRLFSGSRIEKLLDDISQFMVSLPSQQGYNPDQKSVLRESCWKGLYQCLDETSVESLESVTKIEKCMESLFASLTALQYDLATLELNAESLTKEWSEAVTCLGKSRRDWLYEFLQVSHLDPISTNVQFCEDLKKIQARAKLTRVGSIPFTELGRMKSIILNCRSHEIWGVLIEGVAALQKADAGVRREWLISAGEISCISNFPSTALLFIGLLSSSCCSYMPLLLVDQSTVLNDLPVTLTSLLSDPSWEIIAETFISYLWSSMQRIHDFVASKLAPGMEDSSSTQPIDASERVKAPSLLKVMHRICVSFKELLPLDKQLRLASMATETGK